MLGLNIGQIKEELKSLNEKYERVLNQQETIMKKLEDVINGTKFQKKKRVLVDSYTKVGFNELHSFQFSILVISNLVLIKNISCIMSQIIDSLITLGHEGQSVHCTMLLIPLHHLCLLKNPLFSQLLSLGNSGNGIAISGRISDIPKVNL